MSNESFKEWALGILQQVSPARYQLIRMTPELPGDLNPFAEDGVIIAGAMMYAGGAFNKVPVAWQLLYDGIESGEVTEDTTVIVASSGQTALALAMLCKMLGLKCIVIMSSDAPPLKAGAIEALGYPIEVRKVAINTIELARTLGAQPGNFDSGQYDRPGNVNGQATFMAPQLFALNDRIDLVFVPTGTIGTAGGIAKCAHMQNLTTIVIPAVCKEGQQVPAGRTRSSIDKDVKTASLNDFQEVVAIGRYLSFLAAYALWRIVPWSPPGPTSGLAYAATLQFLDQHKRAGTLDQFRGPDGLIRAVFMCPDENKMYLDLFKGVLYLPTDFASMSIPASRLIEPSS